MTRQQSARIKVDDYTLSPGSTVRATMYSEPTVLGDFIVNNSGGIGEDVILPEAIFPGYHVLVLEAQSYSGEPMTLYQFVTVNSGIDGDIDGDGILDVQDSCQFIESWFEETTGRDICVVAKESLADQESPGSLMSENFKKDDRFAVDDKDKINYGRELGLSGDNQYLLFCLGTGALILGFGIIKYKFRSRKGR